MPGRAPTAGKKLVYLDWSVFGEAFDGSTVDAAPAQHELNRTVQALAAGTNLCFSLVHVWELAHLEDPAKRSAFARWLDQLGLVWIRSDNDVVQSEVLHAVTDAIRGTRTPPVLPTAPSFLSVFHGLDQQALSRNSDPRRRPARQRRTRRVRPWNARRTRRASHVGQRSRDSHCQRVSVIRRRGNDA